MSTETAFYLSQAVIDELRTHRGEGMISAVGEYTPEEFWGLLDHAEALMHARKAWRDKATAESQLARLRGYRGRPTPGMKDDMNRWSRLLSEADATLRRVLGGAR